MSKVLKSILMVFVCIVLIGVAWLVARAGGGGAITKQVAFSINVNAAGDYNIAITPTTQTCTKGQVLTFQVTNTVTGGFDAQIEYSVAGLPANSYTFSTNPVAPGTTTNLVVNTGVLTSNTSYSCTLMATDR